MIRSPSHASGAGEFFVHDRQIKHFRTKIIDTGHSSARFAKSITSSWSAFFSSNRQARQQREQQLNIALQSASADDHAIVWFE